MSIALLVTGIIIAILGILRTIDTMCQNYVLKQARELMKFTGQFDYPIIPASVSNDPFSYGMAFQMDGFIVHFWVDTDYRDDGTFNYNTCYLRGINSWSGIDLPLGTDLSHIYFNTTKLMKQIEGRGLKVEWKDDWVEKQWNKLVSKMNVLETCVRQDCG